jgi:hypothetical protein
MPCRRYGRDVSTRVAIAALGLVVSTAFGISGCFLADREPSGIDVLNGTGRTLWIDDDPAPGSSLRSEAEPRAWINVDTDECTDRRIEAQTRSGRVLAVLDHTWCPGQVWQITGDGEFVVIRDAP